MTQYTRLTGETAKAYEAFTVYRELETGKRSLEAVAQMLNKSKTLLARWSTANNWVERAAAYDDHLREQERLEYEKARKIAKRNRITILGGLERIVVAAIKEMQAKGNKDYSPSELTQAIRLLLEQERIEFDDLPTQKHEVSGEGGGPIKFTEVIVELPNESMED